mgnify:CR=1 FL=1
MITIREVCGWKRPQKVDGNRMLKMSKHDKERFKNVAKMFMIREVCEWKRSQKVDENRMLKNAIAR